LKYACYILCGIRSQNIRVYIVTRLRSRLPRNRCSIPG